jgi:hypothetical protein
MTAADMTRQRAAKACADADLEWDEASAWWHAAEALTKNRTRPRRGRRDPTAGARTRHGSAGGAAAYGGEALAQRARVSLAAIDESQPAETEACPVSLPANGRSSPPSCRSRAGSECLRARDATCRTRRSGSRRRARRRGTSAAERRTCWRRGHRPRPRMMYGRWSCISALPPPSRFTWPPTASPAATAARTDAPTNRRR